MSEQRERNAPRISVNKLGEYLVASASRRQTIINDQKKPRDFIVARYRESQKAIVEFLVNNQPVDFLRNEIDRLNSEASASASSWQLEDFLLSARAIESFLGIYQGLNLEACTLEKGNPESQPLLVSNVQVSVRPDIIIRSQRRDGAPSVGAIKLYFSKTNSLNEESGNYITTALREYLIQSQPDQVSPDLRRCYVIDVFSQSIFTAPQSFARRFRDIVAACQEIERAW